MKIYDVSMLVKEGMQVYKNSPNKQPVFSNHSNFETSSAYETNVKINLHTGTHMDFPLHMLKTGKTSDSLDLHRLITKVKVFDLTHLEDGITDQDLKNLEIAKDDFVLFKTRNSFEDTFNFSFIYLKESAAKYLASCGISGVGVDGLGVERDQAGHPTHKILMNQEITIIEGLRLSQVPEGSYMMFALPIKMPHVDALLLSVVLVEGLYDSISDIIRS